MRLSVIGLLAFSSSLAVIGLVQGNPGSAAIFGGLTAIGLALEATRESRRRRQQEALEKPGAFRTLMLKWSVVTGALFLIALILFVTAALSPEADREPLFVSGSLSALMATLLSYFLIVAYRRTNGGKDIDSHSQPDG